jgi:hypothetical protein
VTPTIRWDWLAEAKDFYEALGYAYTDVPWVVRARTYYATKPPSAGEDLYIPEWHNYLCASGEQGLVESSARLLHKKLQTITPCFRDEPQYDALHLPHFMKLELMVVLAPDDDPRAYLGQMLASASRFFGQKIAATDASTDVFSTGPESYDITCNGIEIGSYGIRALDDFRWVYGTGLAEPRFSQAIAS